MNCPNCSGELKLETRMIEDEQRTLQICDACGFKAAKNHLKVDELWAWVSVDPTDQNEGVIAFNSPVGPMPMVGADRERMMSMRKFAEQTVQKSGIEVKLLRFTKRSEIEVLKPKSN